MTAEDDHGDIRDADDGNAGDNFRQHVQWLTSDDCPADAVGND